MADAARDHRDPAQVTLSGGTIVVTTDCCHTRMALPRERVDLVLTQWLACRGCKRQRQLDFVSDPRTGLRAVWSDLPAGRLR